MDLRVARETQEETVFGIENLFRCLPPERRTKHHLVHVRLAWEDFVAHTAPRITLSYFAPYSGDDGPSVGFLFALLGLT